MAYLVGMYPAISHTFILREIRGLRAQGVDVLTISIHRPSRADLASKDDREEFESTYYLTPPRVLDHVRAHARALARPARYLRALAQAQRAGDPGLRARVRQLMYFAEGVVCWWRCASTEVRHIHGEFCGPASDAAMVAAALGGDGWTWSFAAHGTDIFQVTQHRLGAKVANATFVVSASEFGRAQLMTLVPAEHWSKIEVVRCGVDLAQYVPPRRRAGGDGLRILSVGRLAREKGQLLMLEAVAELVRQQREASLALIGDGAELVFLQERAVSLGIAGRVRFHGRVGQDEIRAHYAEANVFCLSSLGEGVPVVLMEAMAMGVPVIAPRLMGIPELIDDRASGLLFTPGRSDDLARALIELADAPEFAAELAVAGRKRIESNFEIGRCVSRLLNVLEAYADAAETARSAA